ncbi:tetratricopeptide repeat-containing sensor histidine kinase [Larkinella humicola]|uniref:histidine kinase n=1 Tax=Larkinella humicola TaxID=2607654 RepID=A0A5N1JF87_9BACT|nr:tetratricopeptide repeat protein [Larkinella humicola]KAA9354051.1 tetratricopeptide repeat protein [Larkinella humicola]
MKIGYLIVSFWLVYQLAGAQVPQTLDSVMVYLKNHTDQDTNRVIALNVMGRELHSTGNPDYKRADSALRVSEKLALNLHYGLGLGKAYTNIASIYFLTDRPQQALAYFQKALSVAESYPLSLRFTCGAFSNVAAAYNKLGQYDKVVEIQLRSLRLQEEKNLQPRISATYEGLGNAYRNLGKPREALPYYQQALAIRQAGKEIQGMAIVENNLGVTYDLLEQYNQSIPYYRRALKHAEEVNFELLQADILVNLGLVYRLTNRPLEGLPYVKRSLAIEQKLQNKGGLGTAFFNLGQIYQDLKQLGPAEDYMKKALALANEVGNKQKITDYTAGLAELYNDMKEYKLAYDKQVQLAALKDSSVTLATNRQVEELITQYKTEKKEQQIKLLNQQARIRDDELANKRLQTTALLMGAVMLLLLGAAVTAWLLNRARLRRLEEAQQLRKQIAHDLHDEVGSTLSSISLLSGMVNGIIAQNRPESVERAVQKINTDARQILEAMDEIIWTINPSNDTLHRIALRLQEYAQPLMESKNIQFSLVADPVLDSLPISMEVRRNLYLIGKEAINNLVKHSEATIATMRFEHQKDQLNVVIEDNGRGFDTSQLSERTGQTSMQQRAKAMAATLNVQSGTGFGTTLQVSVPIG